MYNNSSDLSKRCDMNINQIFGFLKPDEIESLKINSNIVNFRQGDVIIKQSIRTSHLILLLSGLVKIFKEGRNNKILTLKLLKPNDFMGLLSFFGSDMHEYSASAVEDCKVCYIDRNCIKTLMVSNYLFGSFITEKVSKQGLYIFDKMMNHYQKQLPGRIADVILYFSEEIYQSHTFIFPLSRKELAELAGTTKESFIRTLSEFKNDRIIQLDGKKVTIMSMKILRVLSKLG